MVLETDLLNFSDQLDTGVFQLVAKSHFGAPLRRVHLVQLGSQLLGLLLGFGRLAY